MGEQSGHTEAEAAASQSILTAHGYGESHAEWRRAAGNRGSLVSTAAYYLLTRAPRPHDETLFRRGMENRDESVRALAAYGLARLGDEAALVILRRVARLDPDVFLGAPRAAGLLAELGEASGFGTMLRGMASRLSGIRIWTAKNLPPFVPLHGTAYGLSGTVDVWALYAQALKDDELNVCLVARAQLAIIEASEAVALLEEYSTT